MTQMMSFNHPKNDLSLIKFRIPNKNQSMKMFMLRLIIKNLKNQIPNQKKAQGKAKIL